jgi:hypothetical protein
MRWALTFGVTAALHTSVALGSTHKAPEPAPVQTAQVAVSGTGLSVPSTALNRVELAALHEGLRGDSFGTPASPGAGSPRLRESPKDDTSDPETVINTDLSAPASVRWTAWMIGLLGIVWFTGRRRRVP